MATRREVLMHLAAASVAAMSVRTTHALGPATSGSAGVAQTVLGPLDVAKLGFTLSHEHIAGTVDVLKRWPKAWGGRTEFLAKAVDRLKVIRAAGIGTIVDLTPYDGARDVRLLEELSRRSGLNIIACTGQRFFPPKSPHVSMPARTVVDLAKFFIEEIENGIDGTGIKAGVIKIGIETGRPTALEEMGLRAAVRASKATGIPIRIHTNAAHRAGESDAVILEEEGASPARVSFDHSDDSGDMDYFLGLVRRGYSLGMDHVHRGLIADFKPSFERRAECIKLLIDAGFADRIFLSSDSMFEGSLLPEDARNWRENIDPPEGMLFNTHKLIPLLESMGVSDEKIRVMTIENPKRFFARSEVLHRR